jgi:KUP system potassium uptake protein
VVTIKYVTLAMRIDNDGEGGILALMALLGMKRQNRPVIVAGGLFGAALIYGDGAITPAISVLSALEGLEVVTPLFKPYILPLALGILAGLFLIQPLGTGRIGRAFGPIILVWFLVMAALGIGGIVQHPAVLTALNPMYALSYLTAHGSAGFLVLGGVFLCVTGAEALYADMGHFGAEPIRLAWMAVVFPCLLLNYAGQGAYLLAHGPTSENVFYLLCPAWLVLPLVVLATLATVIASQAMITGAFSMTRQAIRLGWMVPLRITQTSREGYGQIYVGAVNWTLMVVTIALTVIFQKSESLASAYGIAVSATMLMTTALLYLGMREIWQWGFLKSASVAGSLLVVDAAFFGANIVKVAEGGYIPVTLAILIFGGMYVWHTGLQAVRARIAEHPIPLDQFCATLVIDNVARVPGTAIFLTREKENTPPVIVWYVSHTHALQENVVALTIEAALVPWVETTNRATVTEIGPNFWRIVARYGFLERAHVVPLVEQLANQGPAVDLEKATYFVGLEIIEPRSGPGGLSRPLVNLFAALQRNAAHVSDQFDLPREHVIEIGRRVGI